MKKVLNFVWSAAIYLYGLHLATVLTFLACCIWATPQMFLIFAYFPLSLFYLIWVGLFLNDGMYRNN